LGVEPAFASLASAAIRLLFDFSLQEFANTAWSLALLVIGNDPLRQSLATAALRRLSEFDAQSIDATLWAMWGISAEVPTTLKRAARHIVSSCAPNLASLHGLDLLGQEWAGQDDSRNRWVVSLAVHSGVVRVAFADAFACG